MYLSFVIKTYCMSYSLTLARIIGPSFLAIALAMVMHPHVFREALAEFKGGGQKMLLLLAGCVHVILGLFLVVTHNSWLADWTTLLTIVGWLLLFRGIFLLWFPNSMAPLAKLLEAKPWWVNLAAIILLIGGSILSYYGFASLI